MLGTRHGGVLPNAYFYSAVSSSNMADGYARRPMQMQRQACMRKACVLGLLLAVAACTDAAEAVQPQGTWRHLQQAADGQPAARRLLQAPACPGPLCAGPAGQTGPPQNAGLGGPSGPGAGGGAVSRAAPVMTPTNALPAAQSSPAASAGGVASPALSPDGESQQPFILLMSPRHHWPCLRAFNAH